MDLENPRLHRPPVMGKIYGKMTSPSMSESCNKSQTNPQQSAGPISFLFDGGTWWYYRLATRFFLQAPKSSTAPPESLPLWTWRKARFAQQCVCTLMIYSICGGVFFLGIWCCRIPTMCVCMCLVCLTILFWDNHMWLLKSAVVMLIHGLLAQLDPGNDESMDPWTVCCQVSIGESVRSPIWVHCISVLSWI